VRSSAVYLYEFNTYHLALFNDFILYYQVPRNEREHDESVKYFAYNQGS